MKDDKITMATIKSYTDLEQSKKLAEILPLESADYFHAPDAGIVVTEPYKLTIDDETVITAYKGAIPCWSLAALLKIIGHYTLQTVSKDKKVFIVSEENYPICSDIYSEPVDACYEMIIKLNGLKIL